MVYCHVTQHILFRPIQCTRKDSCSAACASSRAAALQVTDVSYKQKWLCCGVADVTIYSKSESKLASKDVCTTFHGKQLYNGLKSELLKR
jgi:hypothetical protein